MWESCLPIWEKEGLKWFEKSHTDIIKVFPKGFSHAIHQVLAMPHVARNVEGRFHKVCIHIGGCGRGTPSDCPNDELMLGKPTHSG